MTPVLWLSFDLPGPAAGFWVTYLGTASVLYIPIGARTCKAMSECVERIPAIPLLGPGGLARCWVPGREGRGAVAEGADQVPTQQLTLL